MSVPRKLSLFAEAGALQSTFLALLLSMYYSEDALSYEYAKLFLLSCLENGVFFAQCGKLLALRATNRVLS